MFPKARTEDLILQQSGDELLVYDLKTNKALCLNQTAAMVWQLCDGSKSISALAQDLESEFGAAVTKDLVRFALVQLQEVELLADHEQFSDRFQHLSRREIIKRIGLTSAVAFPIVASLIVPTSAYAQSCPGFQTVVKGDPCTRSCECEGSPPANDPLCCEVDKFTCKNAVDVDCLPF